LENCQNNNSLLCEFIILFISKSESDMQKNTIVSASSKHLEPINLWAAGIDIGSTSQA
jgi:hypothetical protein